MKLKIKILIFILFINSLFIFFFNIQPSSAFDKTQKDNNLECLRIPISGQISTIDPGKTFDTTSIELTEQLFLGLTDLTFHNFSFQVVPSIAQNWSITNDGKTYTFYLRQDIYWTEGVSGKKLGQLTAHDIVWTIRRNINPDNNFPYASVLNILKNGAKINSGKITDYNKLGVKAIDDFTIEFQLEHSAAYFTILTSLWIFRPLPKDSILKYGEKWTRPENINTNGPYFLVEWHKRRKMTLKKNLNYYEADKVSIPEINYIVVPQTFAALDMFIKNELDIIGGDYIRIPPNELYKIISDPDLGKQYHKCPNYTLYCFHFNVKRPPVNNLLVRKAILASINRKLIVDIITRCGESPADSFTPPMLLGYKNNNVDPLFNPKQAKEWLKKAGYPNGEGFPELILMHDISDTHSVIAKALRSFVQFYLNIKVTIVEKEWEKFVENISMKDELKAPHIFRLGWASDYMDANNWLKDAFYTFQEFNNWDNKDYNKLVSNAEKECDIMERFKIYQQAEKLITRDEAVIIPMYFEKAHYLINPRLKTWYPAPSGGQQIKDWSFNDITSENNKNALDDNKNILKQNITDDNKLSIDEKNIALIDKNQNLIQKNKIDSTNKASKNENKEFIDKKGKSNCKKYESKDSSKALVTKEFVIKDTSKESIKKDTSEESIKKDISKESIKKDTSEESIKKDTSEESIKKDISKESIKKDISEESIKNESLKSNTIKKVIAFKDMVNYLLLNNKKKVNAAYIKRHFPWYKYKRRFDINRNILKIFYAINIQINSIGLNNLNYDMYLALSELRKIQYSYNNQLENLCIAYKYADTNKKIQVIEEKIKELLSMTKAKKIPLSKRLKRRLKRLIPGKFI